VLRREYSIIIYSIPF